MAADYRSTLFLPRTEFPMKAGLPKNEPIMLASWDAMGLYRRLREASRGREKFVLHDGPPYANGHLHIGHALNKILKDVVVRCHQMLGYDSAYVPGWDCHGLPIEWKIEERYRDAGKDKDHVPILEFRRECREFAAGWIDVQRAEFKRLGCIGDWEKPYSTMDFTAEAQIVREIGKFLMNGGLYRGAKPVLWSVVEKTALAEAEIEYHDHASPTIFARFPVMRSTVPGLKVAAIVIWTTTPWTIPGNRAIAYGESIQYQLFEVRDPLDGSLAKQGERLMLAQPLAQSVADAAKCRLVPVQNIDVNQLKGLVCRHPLHGKGYDFDVPLLPAGFVDTATGTGFVHVAPGHGADDWELGIRHGIEIPATVGPDGAFFDHVPLFNGKRVLTPEGKEGDANRAVIAALKEAGALLAEGKLVHPYPHSWRSKAPLIFRNTEQWFISMEKNALREIALRAIDATRFVPASGRNRLRGMIETRPDWCVSRQRAWGVPIAVFVNKKTGQPLRDQKVLDRIVAAVEAEGADAWFSSRPARFLGNEYDPEEYEQVMDILDVWFESGCTHGFVLEPRPDLRWPASLYLEGSDQHRGWFHSSLLESCGTRGRAPYESVLTHGFVMAEDGQKMSKSLGNIVAPQEVVDVHGADILRLWVLGSDYSEDLRIGPDILKQHADLYRRIRNTLRYLLSNLNGFGEDERVELDAMPELEKWVLHRLSELDRGLRRACADLTFHPFFADLHHFCAVDLSAFYFDVRKDSLYCDRGDSARRRAARTVLDHLFDCLVTWLAPFLCFTAEEAWRARRAGPSEDSVHLQLFPKVPDAWRNDALAAKWQRLRDARRVVTAALERARAEKKIGASLEAAPVVFTDGSWDRKELESADFAEICITSGLRFDGFEKHQSHGEPHVLEGVSGIAVGFERAAGKKCERCWKVLEEVGTDAEHPDVCGRCSDAVRHHRAAAE